VVVNGAVIPQDGTHTNGWDYVDPILLQAIEIYGPICDALMAGTPTTVNIWFYVYGLAAPAL
jgi:hypothetical protein